MRQINSKQVKAFYKVMQKRYGFNVVEKAGSKEMKFIGWVLDAFGIMNKSKFMKKFSTTIGDTVYVPFKIGSGNRNQLIGQIMTCIHESVHVKQYHRHRARFMANYVFNKTMRTHYEIDAYRTNMEMYYYFKKKVLSPARLAGLLSNYGVDKDDIKVATKHLKIASKVVKYGAVFTSNSKYAIKWWSRKDKK